MPEQDYFCRSMRAAVDAKKSGFTGTSEAFLNLAVAEIRPKAEVLLAYSVLNRRRAEAGQKKETTVDIP